MDRRYKKADLRTDVVCMECKESIDYFYTVKSTTWFMGMVGSRARLCSIACRDAYDERNLVAIRAAQDEAEAS